MEKLVIVGEKRFFYLEGGAVRLLESLIWAAALAGGFMTAMLIIELLL